MQAEKGSFKKSCSNPDDNHEDYQFLVYKPILLHQQDSRSSYMRYMLCVIVQFSIARMTVQSDIQTSLLEF